VFRILKRPDENWCQNLEMQILAKKKTFYLLSSGSNIPYIGDKGYDSVSLKRKQPSWEKVVQSFNARNPDGDKRNMKAVRYGGSVRNCKRERTLKSNGGKCY